MAIIDEIAAHRTPARRVRIPIRIKITVPYLVLSIILAVAAAYIITQLIVEMWRSGLTSNYMKRGKYPLN